MTVRFLTTLDVRYIDGQNWQLLAPLLVAIGDSLIRVPNGFITDFASVPRIPLAFMLFGNIGHRAAVVHDYLYVTAQVSRKQADEILRDLLREEGAGSLRASLMYAGVRVGGASHYKP
jgi:hypothetical protein